MPYEYTHTRRVEFAETDMAGIMHFSNYFRFMESCEHAFFRSLGQTLHTHADGRMQGWARVHARCDYSRPLRYQDEVLVRLLVREKGPTSLTYDFHFLLDGEPVARGALTVVCVAREAGEERMRPVPMPDLVAREVLVAPADVLDPDPA